jgi:hypothetical protein
MRLVLGFDRFLPNDGWMEESTLFLEGLVQSKEDPVDHSAVRTEAAAREAFSTVCAEEVSGYVGLNGPEIDRCPASKQFVDLHPLVFPRRARGGSGRIGSRS